MCGRLALRGCRMRLYIAQRRYMSNGGGYPIAVAENQPTTAFPYQLSWPTSQKDHDAIFRMCLPPPNVTGDLHIGHAFTIAIQDSIIRWHKLNGSKTIWVPGFDHAGIATQVVVEKRLLSERGLTRKQLSHTEFIYECQQWQHKRMQAIQSQFQKLGASLDYETSYMTLDEKFTNATHKAFKTLYDRGLILRDKRLVNWSPFMGTTLSEQEVINIAVQPQSQYNIPGTKQTLNVGALYKIQYELEDGAGHLSVCTTRPETILADSALVVNFDDPRYQKYIGRKVKHPLFPQTLMTVIADSAVKIEFGTGVLKLTPAHDMTDWQIYRRHERELPQPISCITPQGYISDGFGEYSGIDRFTARDIIAGDMLSSGSCSEVQPYEGTLAVCSRSGDVIEPLIKEQWFIDCNKMAQTCIQASESGMIKFVPSLFVQQWRNWLTNPEPWCISRQIDWGHQIPAYKYQNQWVVASSLQDAKAQFSELLNENVDECEIIQDEDVVDTWFTSSLIPIVANNWPQVHNPPPLNLMETGHDIIGFWVARMAMLCTELTGNLPFDTILLHGLLRDSEGHKMSKSKGNAIDPLHVINGATLKDLKTSIETSCGLTENELRDSIGSLEKNFAAGIGARGSDSLRFSLLRHDIQQMHIHVHILEETKNAQHFGNKIYNGVRFYEILRSQLPQGLSHNVDKCELGVCDLWLRSRLRYLAERVETAMHEYSPHIATMALYDFWWSDLCDVYLELAKKDDSADRLPAICDTLESCISTFLVLLHPFMPYLTQYIMHRQFPHSPQVLRLHEFDRDQRLEHDVNRSLKVVKVCRSARSEFKISSKERLKGRVSSVGDYAIIRKVIEPLAELELNNNVDSMKDTVVFLVEGETRLMLQIPPSSKQIRRETLNQQLQKKITRIAQLESNIKGWNCPSPKESERRMAKRLKSLNKANRDVKLLQTEIQSVTQIIRNLEN